MPQYRYPGPQPFTERQRHLFFGRNEEMDELLRFVKHVPWVVIYGKSGLGKSSLLNAGLIPRLEEESQVRSIFIRFGAWIPGTQTFPLGIAKETLASENLSIPEWFSTLAEEDDCIWRLLKERQLFGIEPQRPVVLVLDQFEELFTYPKEAVKDFAKEMAEVFYTEIPERYRLRLETVLTESASFLSEDDLHQLHKPLSVKVIVAVRNDRMALLHQLEPHLPSPFENCYELRPLSTATAEEAILNPAYDTGTFRTPQFDYSDEALDMLLGFLSSNNTQDIESFQLQLICEYLEKNVIEKQHRKYIQLSDISEPKIILENYYLNKIKEIKNPTERLAARKLLEEGLIFEEEQRRIPLFEGQIQKNWNVNPTLLAQLENTHLIRREPSLRGGYTYELSHDTLVEPILKAKAKRLADERKARLLEEEEEKQAELAKLKELAEQERRKAEQEKELREKAELAEQKARQQERRAFRVSLLAIGFFIVAATLYIVSENRRIEAEKANVKFEAADKRRMRLEFKSKFQDALHFADVDCELAQKTIDEMNETVEKIPELKVELDSLFNMIKNKCNQ